MYKNLSCKDDLYPFILIAIENYDKYGIDYEVIKYDKRKQTISFIQSPDWNSSNEPYVSYSVVINIKTCKVKIIKGRKTNPQIYHHKWMFVADDYDGFDVLKSKIRTNILNSVASFNDKDVKSKIGNKEYWNKWCKENRIDI